MENSFAEMNTTTPLDMAYTAFENISSVLKDMTTFGYRESSVKENRLDISTDAVSTMSSLQTNTSDTMDPMCGVNKMLCPVNICFKMNGVYNGICCQFVRVTPPEQFCVCKDGFTGQFCHEYSGHHDIQDLFEAFAVMQKSATNNVILLGVLLCLMAISLAAVVIFVVFRVTRQKKLLFVEEGEEPGSPSRNLNNDTIDNVILVRSRASIMRYNSVQASYCGTCRQASQRSNAPLPISPPGSSRTDQFSPTRPPVLSPHLEEDETEGGVIVQEPLLATPASS